jgi:DMSO reductase anchor subunit
VIDQILALGTAVVVALGVLIVVQLTLMVLALINLSKTPVERLRGPRILWVLVIVFGELVGPVVYFAVARKPEVVEVVPGPSDATPGKAESAANLLYGGTEEGPE